MLSLSFVMYTGRAYAVMDLMGKVQSVLEKVERVKKQVEQEVKKAIDIKKRVVQGYETAKGCVTNPVACAMNVGLKYGAGYITGEITGFPTLSGVSRDVLNVDMTKLEEDIRSTEYKRGGADAIDAVYKNRQKNSAVARANIAILFAKAAATKQSMYQEGNDIYPREFDDNLESILKARGQIEMMSNYRLSRILEMRAYMNSGAGVSGLTLHTRSKNDDE